MNKISIFMLIIQKVKDDGISVSYSKYVELRQLAIIESDII